MHASAQAVARIALRAASVTACLVPAAFALSEPTELKPDWDLAIERGVEWCAPVDGNPAAALLVCTKESQLDLIDIETGRSRLPNPHRVPPGTRFAGESNCVAFCYSPSLVDAIRVAPDPGDESRRRRLLWRVAGAPYAESQGDPEFLTLLVAAQATPRGVMIVRSDGRVAELAHDDGAVLWRRELGDAANYTLQVNGKSAALLWKAGPSTKTAFFDLSQKTPEPRSIEFDTPPIWSQLTDMGLVVVRTDRFAVARPSHPVVWFEFKEGSQPASAASIAVHVARGSRGAEGDVADAAADAILYFANHDARLFGYGLPAGRIQIGRDYVDAPVTRTSRAVPPVLRVSGDHVIASGGNVVRVYTALSGERIERFRGLGAVSAGVSDGFAYGLFCENKRERPRGAVLRALRKSKNLESRRRALENITLAYGAGPLRLFRRILPGRPWPRPDEPVDPGVREYSLSEAHPVRESFWLGEKLVIVEENRIRAYTLP